MGMLPNLQFFDVCNKDVNTIFSTLKGSEIKFTVFESTWRSLGEGTRDKRGKTLLPKQLSYDKVNISLANEIQTGVSSVGYGTGRISAYFIRIKLI